MHQFQLASVSAAALVVAAPLIVAGCAPQPIGYTPYFPRPVVGPYSGVIYYSPPPPRPWSPPNYGSSRPFALQIPPSDAGGDRSGSFNPTPAPPEPSQNNPDNESAREEPTPQPEPTPEPPEFTPSPQPETSPVTETPTPPPAPSGQSLWDRLGLPHSQSPPAAGNDGDCYGAWRICHFLGG